jgi:hypothetical protein
MLFPPRQVQKTVPVYEHQKVHSLLEETCVPWHDNPAHRPRNHTLYDTPPIRFVFQVTQEDLISSLMMAGYCRNM